MTAKTRETRTLARNKKAKHDYEILERFVAGIVLVGTEVKAAREGKVQLRDSYVEIRDGEAWLVGAHISPYSHGNRQNHDPDRRRKLLLHRREIDRIFGRTSIQGQTCIPLAIYADDHLIKAEIALARGRKHYDKRQAARARIADQEAREAVDR